MRVALLCYRGNPYCGGQGIYVYNLARELARNNVEVDVIVGPPYPESMDGFAATYKTENLHLWAVKTSHFSRETLAKVFKGWNFVDYLLTRFHFFGEIETFSFRAFALLSALMKQKQYDIIHDINSLGWGLWPTTFFGVPVVSTIHHPLTRDRNADLARNNGFWAKITTLLFYPVPMQRFVVNRIDGVITSFKGGVDELNQAFGIPVEKIVSVYNGMDTNLFRYTGVKREAYGLLFVGNSEDEKKGIRYLLEAMTLLPHKVTLTIVDAVSSLKTKAADLIDAMGLESRVVITGRLTIEEIVALYSRKTMLVVPSLYEGFGLPAVEAMACEMPVIAARSGALCEVVTDDTGILVEPGNPRAIADAVTRLLANSRLQKKMGAAGKKRANELFSWEAAGKNTIAVYRQFINKKRGAA